MPFVRFQELAVYKLAEELADAVWAVVSGWNNLARDTVGKQVVRAADSVGANIAEGSGRHSRQDNRRFVRIARGSLLETQHWLRRAFSRNLLTAEQTATLRGLADRLAPTLNAYLRSIDRPAGGEAPNTKH